MAERNGKVLGVGAFYTGKDEGRLTLGFVQQAVTFYPFMTAVRVIYRALHLAPLLKPLYKNMLYVANLGVHPQAQSQGIGRALLNHHITQAKAQSLRCFGLDVALTNPRAEVLYAGLGLQVTNTKFFKGDKNRNPQHGRVPVPDCKRMVLELSAA